MKLVKAPSVVRTTLSLHDGELLIDASQYRSMVGASQYLTMTQPDSTFAVHVVYYFVHASGTTHLYAVKRIFRYFQDTFDHGLLIIVAYSDADQLVVRIPTDLTPAMECILYPILLPDTPRSNPRDLSPSLKLNIVVLVTLLQRQFGLSLRDSM